VIVTVVLGDQPPATRRDLILVAMLAGAATVAAVTLATVIIINRVLGASLRELTAAIRSAERGKWLARARSDREDEIGQLSRAFDGLAAQLTDLSVTMIDTDRELAWTRRELQIKEAISLLFELTQTIDAQQDLPAVLRAIPAKVGPALGFEEMAILLLDPSSGLLVVRATYGFPPGTDVEGMTFSPGEGISGLVAQGGEPLVIEDTARDARYTHYKGKHAQDGSFACVPMKLKGRLKGLFNVLRPKTGGFSDADVALLRSLASYTALAIAHAEMTTRLRELSVTDDLTGVANRRLLMERVGREVERARRGGKPLSALMLDLDHFKRVNDLHGHLRGDEVLRQVARVLTDGVRRLDTVARYGGEEFVVLLPDSNHEQALHIAEKLRAAIKETALGDIHLTISIGVATFPDDAQTEPALIDAADRALFAAKRAGRDRVVPYDPTLLATTAAVS